MCVFERVCLVFTGQPYSVLTPQSTQPTRVSTIIIATEEGIDYVIIHTHMHAHTQTHTDTRTHTVNPLYCVHVHTATGLQLRSDICVDTIVHIDITTRTRELLLEEEPEKFEVRAFDDEGISVSQLQMIFLSICLFVCIGNMFSTVRGHVSGV